VDRPSVNIPATYIGTALILGQVLEQVGDSTEANRLRKSAVDMAQATHTLELFTGPEVAAPPAAAGTDAPRGTPIPSRP